jgi:hypothetical protein
MGMFEERSAGRSRESIDGGGLRSAMAKDGAVICRSGERSKEKAHKSERMSARWAAVAPQARKRSGKGGSGPRLPGPQRGQARAIYIKNETSRAQVFYESKVS